MDPDDLLRGLTDAQRHAVTVDAAPLCIVAGAGSGKTRVLTRRIAYRSATGSLDPRRALAITFTRKAAGELRSRLAKLGLPGGVGAGTFHAVAWSQLRQRWEGQGQKPPALLTRKAGIVAILLGPRAQPGQVLEVVGEIEWASARMIDPEHYCDAAGLAARRIPGMSSEEVADTFHAYARHKREKRLVDFDDLLRLAAGAIHSDEGWAASRRWMHRHLFVDEFQDVTPLQVNLLRAWLGASPDLCAVGDPNQSIYAWNGADVSALTDFTGHFGGVTVALDENFRSTAQVVSVANSVLAAGGIATTLVPPQRDGPVPSVSSSADGGDELRNLASLVTRIHKGAGASRPGRRRWAEQAVLARTNAIATEVAAHLLTEGIPCALRGGASLLDLPAVDATLRSIERAPGPLASQLDDLASRLNDVQSPGGTRTGASSEDDEVAEDGDPPTSLDMGRSPRSRDHAQGADDPEQATAMASFVNLGREYLAIDPSGSASTFRVWLSTIGDRPSPHSDAVQVCTFHAAKGLEFPVVHIVALEDGLVPIAHARTREEIEEERRLLYVAVTRAEHEVHFSYSRARTFGDRVSRRDPSPFLTEIEEATASLSAAASPVDPRIHLRDQRQALAAMDARSEKPGFLRGDGPRSPAGQQRSAISMENLDDADRKLLDALRRWRSTVARGASVPAFIVFDDATLADLVSKKPLTTEDLKLVRGIGAVKAERYGPDLIRIVSPYA